MKRSEEDTISSFQFATPSTSDVFKFDFSTVSSDNAEPFKNSMNEPVLNVPGEIEPETFQFSFTTDKNSPDTTLTNKFESGDLIEPSFEPEQPLFTDISQNPPTKLFLNDPCAKSLTVLDVPGCKDTILFTLSVVSYWQESWRKASQISFFRTRSQQDFDLFEF